MNSTIFAQIFLVLPSFFAVTHPAFCYVEPIQFVLRINQKRILIRCFLIYISIFLFSKSEFVIHKLLELEKITASDILPMYDEFNRLDPDNTGKIARPRWLHSSDKSAVSSPCLESSGSRREGTVHRLLHILSTVNVNSQLLTLEIYRDDYKEEKKIFLFFFRYKRREKEVDASKMRGKKNTSYWRWKWTSNSLILWIFTVMINNGNALLNFFCEIVISRWIGIWQLSFIRNYDYELLILWQYASF